MFISTDKDEYAPGETIKVHISVRQDKPTRARGIVAMLFCDEMTKLHVDRVMTDFERQQRRELGLFADTHLKKDTEYRHKIVHRQEKKVAGEGEFTGADYEVEFAIPVHAQPTDHEYGHNNRIIAWKLKVKLDIPLAPDVNVEKEIIVRERAGGA